MLFCVNIKKKSSGLSGNWRKEVKASKKMMTRAMTMTMTTKTTAKMGPLILRMEPAKGKRPKKTSAEPMLPVVVGPRGKVAPCRHQNLNSCRQPLSGRSKS